MKIKLLEVSLDPQQLQLGTCEVCFSVEFAQFPTFKFEIDESATEYVEMYAYHAPYSYDEVDLYHFGIEYSNGIDNAIDFADWLNQHEFRELHEGETLEDYLYRLTYDYSYGVSDVNPSNQKYIDKYWLS